MLRSFVSPTLRNLSLEPLVRETFFCQEYMKKPEQTRGASELKPQYPGGEQLSRIKKWKWKKMPMVCQHGTYQQIYLNRSKGLVGVAVLQWQVGKRAWACLLWEGGKGDPIHHCWLSVWNAIYRKPNFSLREKRMKGINLACIKDTGRWRIKHYEHSLKGNISCQSKLQWD